LLPQLPETLTRGFCAIAELKRHGSNPDRNVEYIYIYILPWHLYRLPRGKWLLNAIITVHLRQKHGVGYMVISR
jgi:hypothetical protein